MLLWLMLPFYDFAVFNLLPLTVCINCSFLHLYLLFYFQFSVDMYFVILYVIAAIFEKNEHKAEASSAYLVRKVIGDSGTVVSGMIGEHRRTPTPVKLRWIGYLL